MFFKDGSIIDNSRIIDNSSIIDNAGMTQDPEPIIERSICTIDYLNKLSH